MHQAQEMLLRREAPQHLLAEGVLLDGGDEVADDVQVDVGLEERQPYLAERILDVALGDLALPPQFAQQGFELLAE